MPIATLATRDSHAVTHTSDGKVRVGVVSMEHVLWSQCSGSTNREATRRTVR